MTSIEKKKALVVCSGPSARVIKWDQWIPWLLSHEPVTIYSVNSTIYCLPMAHVWVTVDKTVATELDLGRINYDILTKGIDLHLGIWDRDLHHEDFEKNLEPVALCGWKYRVHWEPLTKVDPIHLPDLGFCWDGSLPGHDSGFSAINLAILHGHTKIAVVGFDCTGDEYWCEPTNGRPVVDGSRHGRLGAKKAAAQCAERGIEIVNGSLSSRCEAWPKKAPCESLVWLARKEVK